MRFKTLEKYNKELNEMEDDLAEMESYIAKHPEKLGTKGNYETYKYVYNVFKKDKIEFIENLNQINLKLNGNLADNALTVNDFNKISDNLNETQHLTTNLLNKKTDDDLLVKEVSQGSYKITFAFQNPTEKDVKRTSARKKGLIKIFDFIKCEDDIEKLKNVARPDGEEALKKYKEFLEEIVKHNADFTLDTEMGTLKAGLTYKQCKNICENLNI